MIDLKVHTLEDNKDYCELYTLEDNGIEYLLLIEEANPSNICFRKKVIEDDVEYLDPLEDNEFDYIYEKFKNEFKDLFN